jgi:hypothetical protein
VSTARRVGETGDRWFILRNNQPVGPVTFEALRQMAASGSITPYSRIQREGETKWVQAKSTPLAACFSGRKTAADAAVVEKAKWLRGLFIAGLCLTGVIAAMAVRNLWLLRSLQSGEGGEDAVRALEAGAVHADLLWIGYLGLLLITAFVFCLWVVDAQRNVRDLGAEHLTFTPGWAVGWFFVPIANLWKPYQMMRELWQASARPDNWPAVDVPPLLGAWWGAWIGSRLLGTLINASSGALDTLPALIGVTWWSIVGSLVDIVAYVLVMKVIASITRMQQNQRLRVARTSSAATAPRL